MKHFIAIFLFFFCSLLMTASAQQPAGSSIISKLRFESSSYENQDNQIHQGIQKGTAKSDLYFESSPSWDWERSFGGAGIDAGKDVVTDSESMIYVVGDFSGTTDFGGTELTSEGKRDLFVAKYGPDGTLVWIKQGSAGEYSSVEGFCIFIQNEDLYITGYYNGDQLSLGGYTSDLFGLSDIFIAKLNTSGEFTWLENFGFEQGNLVGLKIAADADQNVYVSGSTNGSVAFRHPSVLVKFDPNGKYIWHNERISSINDIGINNNHLYMAGAVGSPDYFGDTLLSPNNYNDAFLAKSDLDGNILWAVMGNRDEGEFGDSWATDITFDNQDHIYMGGHFRAQVTFGIYMLNALMIDMFITKVDADGEFLWATSSSDGAELDLADVIVDNDQYPCAIGSFRSKAGFGDFYFETDYRSCYYVRFDPESNVISAGEISYKSANFCNQGSGNMIITGTSGHEFFFSEISNTGSQVWYQVAEGIWGEASIAALEAFDKNEFYSHGNMVGFVDLFGTVYTLDENSSFIAKHNRQGDVLWIEIFEGGEADYFLMGNNLTIDRAHHCLYAFGDFDEYIIVGPELLESEDEDGSLYFTKYSLVGDFQWVKQYPKGQLRFNSVDTDMEGNVLLGGIFRGQIQIEDIILTTSHANDDDPLIIKYNAAGELIWAKHIKGSYVEYMGLVSADGEDNIYLATESLSDTLFFSDEDYVLLNDNIGHTTLAKYDHESNLLWAKVLTYSPIPSGAWYNWPVNIISDEAGSCYMTGWHGDSTYFDDIMLHNPNFDYNHFVAKINPNGDVAWANSIWLQGYDMNYNEMGLDHEGNCYIMSEIKDTVIMNGNIIVNRGPDDSYIARYSSEGELNWVKIINSRIAGVHSSGIAVCDTNDLFIGGYFSDLIYFDDDQLFSKSTGGFLAHLSTQTGPHAIQEYVSETKRIQVYPNPTTGLLFISVEGEAGPMQIEVIDIRGQMILKEDILHPGNPHITDLGNLAEGIYLVRVRSGDSESSFKVLLR
jgi:hypothetical protein